MEKQKVIFGFNTKDLSTLNESLKKCNDGKLPSPSEIKKIAIGFASNGLLSVHVELCIIL